MTIRDQAMTIQIKISLPISAARNDGHALMIQFERGSNTRSYTDLITPIKINGELQFNRILWNTSWLEYSQRSHLHSPNTLEWKDHSAPRTAPMNYFHLKFKGSPLQENKGCLKNLEQTHTHILNAPDLQTNEGYVPKFTSWEKQGIVSLKES